MDYGVSIESYRDKKIGYYGGKFFPVHNGHIEMARRAASEVDVLFVVVEHDEKHEAELCENVPFEPVAPRWRERWLSEIFKDDPHIRVLSAPDTRVSDYTTNTLLKAEKAHLLDLVGGRIDIAFSGEQDYDELFAFVLPDAAHRVIEKTLPVSASAIRADLYGHWEYLPEPVRRYHQKRVAFCGGESSGKTFTSMLLAEEHGYEYLPEYGRTFYDELGGYSAVDFPEDFVGIAAGHLQQLHRINTDKPIAIVDTDLIYTQWFYIESYGEPNKVLDEIIRDNCEKISKRIFLMPFRFADDGTRARRTEPERAEAARRLLALYTHYGASVEVVDGTGEERLNRVREILNAS